ncbi:type II toxin-antitoxin system VapC family toxin [Brucella intermedia]|uniref:type II toxin-antitoxin system VapC family toxin n=1 Tax=Brucella intermedia TaxID=94625 RepID=UPI00224B4EDB|nr:DNA-binding protein [Brucella intermedia]
MPSFDIAGAKRWLRSFPSGNISRRPDSELPFFDGNNLASQGLLLDTCVYIDQMQGKLPDEIEEFLSKRHSYHSSVAVQELAHSMGALDPNDPRTAHVQKVISDTIESMTEHRTSVPDIDVLGRAAILNGVICRLQHYSDDQKRKCLQDCTLFLQGLKGGLVILTRNVKDFDMCLQLVPAGRVLFYRV